MTEHERRKEARKQRRLEALGTNTPRCGVCGETAWQCLELHHIAGCQHRQETSILCRNCHRKVTDEQKEHPASDASSDQQLSGIGHFLIGLADMLRLVVENLQAFGTELINRSQMTKAGDRP